MNLQQLTLSLYSAVYVEHKQAMPIVPSTLVTGLNSEIGVLGYTLDGAIIQRLRTYSRADFLEFRTRLLTLLREHTGAFSKHNVLFNKFPYDTPEHAQYLANRLIGYLQNELGIHDDSNYQQLSCGHYIDPAQFSIQAFGACPICQHQVEELDSAVEEAKYGFKSVTPFKVIRLASRQFLQQKGSALLARNSSLSQQERLFLKEVSQLAVVGPLDRPAKVFRETLPLVYTQFKDDEDGLDYLRSLMAGATDVLRIATYLSKEDADLSLSDNTHFKVSTSDKKKLLGILNGMSNLPEDLLRHREKWLRLGEYLNPGAHKNRLRFPTVAKAFDQLRQKPETIQTFNRTVEKTVREQKVTNELLAKLAERPGEFMRRLDWLLRTTARPTVLNEVLSQIAPKVTTKLLIEVNKYLEHRSDTIGQPQERVFMPKGSVTKAQVLPDTRPEISAKRIADTQKVIEAELASRFAKRPAMGKVFIDPALKSIVLPYNRRADSATSSPMMKGSRFKLSPGCKVLRMFIHWTKDTDVDLSTVILDENFSMLTQVSWTSLQAGGIQHSGDLQSAPKGGSEFIDIDLKLGGGLSAASRYVAMSIISYRGLPFNEFPCYAGFMERDTMKSGKRYEPESVSLKFDVNSPTTNHMPLIFDLKTREVIFIDLTVGRNHAYGYVARPSDKTAMLAKSTMELPLRKPTAYDVLLMNVRARGTPMLSPQDADTSITVENMDMEAIMQMTADA